MRIALATDASLAEGSDDDRPLLTALVARGAETSFEIWDDASVDWSSFDGVLIRSTWDYARRCHEFLEWSTRVANLTRLFNGPGVVRWNTHKSYLRTLEAEIDIVPTRWIECGEDFNMGAYCRERGWSAAVLKPQIGATAREAIRFSTDEEGLALAHAHLNRLGPLEDLMLQPYLEAVATRGEISVVLVEEQCAHSFVKHALKGEWRVQTDFGGTETSVETSEELQRSAQAACRTARVALSEDESLLYARADFLPDAEGGWLLGELELVEPALFLQGHPTTAYRLADALLQRVVRGR